MKADIGSIFTFVSCVISLGCSAQPREKFCVDVLGSEAPLMSSVLNVSGLMEVGHLYFDRGYFQREFCSAGPGVLSSPSSVTVSSLLGDKFSSVELRPFVCKTIMDLNGSNGSYVETHDVYLESSGVLEVDTDFKHVLKYRCDSGTAGGVGTLWSAPPLCSDAARSDTKLTLRDAAGVQIGSQGGECSAVQGNRGNGHISIGVAFPGGIHDEFQLGLSYCRRLTDESYPKKFVVGTNFPVLCESSEGGVLQIGSGGERRNLALKSGNFTLNRIELTKPAFVDGDIDLTFSDEGNTFNVSGHLALPMFQVSDAPQ